MPERRRSRAVLPLLVALAAAVALVVVLVGSGDDRPAAEVDRADAVDRGQESTASTEADRALVLGDADARVVMVEYSDFQCPFCGPGAARHGRVSGVRPLLRQP
jgi:protein-disulfide isomerase